MHHWKGNSSKLPYISRWWFQKKKYFHPYLGKISILTNIFQMGWNHQLDLHCLIPQKLGNLMSRLIQVRSNVAGVYSATVPWDENSAARTPLYSLKMRNEVFVIITSHPMNLVSYDFFWKHEIYDMFNMFNEKNVQVIFGFLHHLWEVDSHFLPPKTNVLNPKSEGLVFSWFSLPFEKKGGAFFRWTSR